MISGHVQFWFVRNTLHMNRLNKTAIFIISFGLVAHEGSTFHQNFYIVYFILLSIPRISFVLGIFIEIIKSLIICHYCYLPKLTIHLKLTITSRSQLESLCCNILSPSFRNPNNQTEKNRYRWLVIFIFLVILCT